MNYVWLRSCFGSAFVEFAAGICMDDGGIERSARQWRNQASAVSTLRMMHKDGTGRWRCDCPNGGSACDPTLPGRFNGPQGIAIDGTGNV
jgi:hypothetical protein